MPAALTGSAMVCGLALVLTACAALTPTTATRTPAKPGAPAVAANGTVMAVRPVTDQDLAESAEWRAVLLHAARGGESEETPGVVEVVIREDSGRTVALVQPAPPGCMPGGRVLVLQGQPARCAGF